MELNFAKTLAFACLAVFVVSCKAQKYGDLAAQDEIYRGELDSYATSAVTLEEYSTVFRATIDANQLKIKPNRTTATFFLFLSTTIDLVEVEASIKVFQHNDVKENSLVKYLSKRTFKKNQRVGDDTTIKNFIDINSFNEEYVRDDKATFEIEINTNPVYQQDISPKLGVEIMKKKLHVNIEDIKGMSPPEGGSSSLNISAVADIRGVKWAFTATKKDGFLGVYLETAENNLAKWSYDVDATFKLLTFNSSVEPIQNIFSHKYYVGSASQGFNEFINWTDLVNPLNQFVVNNTATLLVDINVGEPQQIWTF